MAPTPAAVIAKCDVTYAMLADPDAALAVANGPDGVAAGMKANPGRAYVDVSTVDESTSKEIAAAVTSNGGRFLEVPLPPTPQMCTVCPQNRRPSARCACSALLFPSRLHSLPS